MGTGEGEDGGTVGVMGTTGLDFPLTRPAVKGEPVRGTFAPGTLRGELERGTLPPGTPRGGCFLVAGEDTETEEGTVHSSLTT